MFSFPVEFADLSRDATLLDQTMFARGQKPQVLKLPFRGEKMSQEDATEKNNNKKCSRKNWNTNEKYLLKILVFYECHKYKI